MQHCWLVMSVDRINLRAGDLSTVEIGHLGYR